jgi:hypothetical protein
MFRCMIKICRKVILETKYRIFLLTETYIVIPVRGVCSYIVSLLKCDVAKIDSPVAKAQGNLKSTEFI